jgi:hypothetical protein
MTTSLGDALEAFILEHDTAAISTAASRATAWDVYVAQDQPGR